MKLLLLLALLPSLLAASSLDLKVDLADGSPVRSTAARLCLEPLAEGEVDVRCRDLEVPTRLKIDLGDHAIWRLSVEAPDHWAPTEVIVSEEGRQLPIRLFPTGQLTGRLHAPDTQELPSEITISWTPVAPAPKNAPSKVVDSGVEVDSERAAEPPGRARLLQPPPSDTTCPVTASGVFECTVPAARTDAKLGVRGFAPTYLWSLRIQPGSALELGVVPLRPGASLAGWVEFEKRKAEEVGTAEVKLRPAVMATGSETMDAHQRKRLKLRALSTVSDDRGFFQLTDVPPGSYDLTVSREGFATAKVSDLVVLANAETRLSDPVRLHLPWKLEVVVDPPFSPTDDPWTVSLIPRGREDLDDFHRSETDLSGWASFSGVEEGKHLLVVETSSFPSTGLEARWAIEEIDVEAGQGPIDIRIPWVAVEGTVSRGGEPAQTSLWFVGLEGRQRVLLRSDEEGRFEGFLPSEGLWDIEVSPSTELPALQKLEPVEVSKPPGKRTAEITVEIPSTLVSGRVTTEEKDGVPNASVLLVSSEKRSREAQTVSGSDGSFEIRGVRAGPAWLWAEADDRTSEWLPVEIEEDRETAEIELVVRRHSRVEGWVSSPTGKVPGALITVLPETSDGTPVAASRVLTGPDGHFSLTLPKTASSARAVVYPPGYSLSLVRIDLDGLDGSPLHLPVTDSGGTLIIHFATAPVPALLHHGGTFIHLDALVDWGTRQGAGWSEDGEQLVLPRVESGDYTMCLSGRAGGEGISDTDAGPRCVGGFLPRDGELVIEIDPTTPET